MIKRGNSYFDLTIGQISFRDAGYYLGPGSLSKFAKIFSVVEGKKLFPYEFFTDIRQTYDIVNWPEYIKFKSQLGIKKSFTNELKSVIGKFESFGAMLKHFGCSLEHFNDIKDLQYIPELSKEQSEILSDHFTISPVEYLKHQSEFNMMIANGKFENFCDYLKEYNISDTKLLHSIFERFGHQFKLEFNVDLLEKLSLPAVSEKILWHTYDTGIHFYIRR